MAKNSSHELTIRLRTPLEKGRRQTHELRIAFEDAAELPGPLVVALAELMPAVKALQRRSREV